MTLSDRLPGPPNRSIIRVLALRRSGHHAVLNWVRLHQEGRHVLLNDCRPGKNPFSHCSVANSIVKGFWGEHHYLDWDAEAAGRHAKKGTLIYNFEDQDLRDPRFSLDGGAEENWLGECGDRADLLILRDPFNLFASKLRWARGRHLAPSIESLGSLPDLWKIYAREFLGETAHLSDTVTISYNEWFISREYRDDLGRRLGFVNRDGGLQEIARWGPSTWGDSFDGLRHDGAAQAMKVLERWREYRDDPFYASMFRDPDVAYLSGQIFGELPGTRAWLESVGAA